MGPKASLDAWKRSYCKFLVPVWNKTSVHSACSLVTALTMSSLISMLPVRACVRVCVCAAQKMHSICCSPCDQFVLHRKHTTWVVFKQQVCTAQETHSILVYPKQRAVSRIMQTSTLHEKKATHTSGPVPE
jgi:hypothetical protein